MTQEMERNRIVGAIERGPTELASRCAEAMRSDPRDRMKLLAKPASYFSSLYKIKLSNAHDAGVEILGGEDLIKRLDLEGDKPVAMFLTENKENWFTIFTDEAVSRFLGCLVGRNRPL